MTRMDTNTAVGIMNDYIRITGMSHDVGDALMPLFRECDWYYTYATHSSSESVTTPMTRVYEIVRQAELVIISDYLNMFNAFNEKE